MKKLTCLMIAALLLASLAACGEAAPEETTSPAAVEESAAPAESEAPAESDAPAEGEEGSLLETARGYEGAALEDLIAAIGEPESSDYAPSCLGEGEDGNLYYDGFTVYTYRDTDGQETVNYVE